MSLLMFLVYQANAQGPSGLAVGAQNSVLDIIIYRFFLNMETTKDKKQSNDAKVFQWNGKPSQ